MPARKVGIVAPLYLLACLLLGGSVQGIWSNLALQLSAILILAWALIAGRSPTSRPSLRLVWIAVSAFVLIAIQLVPLPPAIWTSLPGRQTVANGFELLGQAMPWMPLSMAPARTLSSLLSLLPACAMLALLLSAPIEKPGRLAAAAIVGAFISVLFAVMQMTRGEAWYPYKIYSLGAATGLFANTNHLASLLLVAFPLLAALGATSLRDDRNPKSRNRLPALVALAIGAAVILIGIALNKSFAILLLAGPIIAASALIFLPAGRVRLGRLALLFLLMLAAGGAALFAVGGDRLTRLAGQASVAERQQIWKSSVQLAVDYMPVGSGLGTFEKVYRLQEDPDRVGREYVNHAHNDFLELVIELGIPGLLLLAAFMAWWASRFIDIWRSSHSPPIVRAASLVSLSLLLHSLVDFPLRPAALATLFAAAIGLMASPGPPPRRDGKGQPRHVKLEDLD